MVYITFNLVKHIYTVVGELNAAASSLVLKYEIFVSLKMK